MNEIVSRSREDIVEAPAAGAADMSDYGAALIAKAWLIALCIALGLFAGISYAQRLSPVYKAQAVLQVDAEEPNVLGFEGAARPEAGSGDVFQTVIASLRSRAFLKRVVGVAELEKRSDFLPAQIPKEQRADVAAEVVAGAMTTQMRPGTRLIDISVEHSSAAAAHDVANAAAEEYVRYAMEQRAAASRATTQFLLSEADRLKKKLHHSEEMLQDYKERANAVSLEEKQDTVVSKLKSQSGQLTEAKANRIRLYTDYQEANTQAGNPDTLLSISSVANYPGVIEARQAVSGLEAKVALLRLRYTERHPKMIQTRTQLAGAYANLRETVLAVPRILRSEYERALATERNFETALRDQEKLALDLNKQAITYNELSRDVETDMAMYGAILRRLKEVDVAKGFEVSSVRVFEHATLPTVPEDPKRMRIIALSIGGGLLLGLLVSIGLHMLDSSIRTLDQAELLTGLTVVGALPSHSAARTNKMPLVVDEPDSPLAESIRSLRTSLYLCTRKTGRNVCLFTSALTGEGKTFSSVNYAVSLAQQGLVTLLIDADLRSPTVSRIFSFEDLGPGLSEFLRGKATLEQVIHETDVRNLFIIPAGQLVSNPAELLGNHVFNALMKGVSTGFDQIVIDTAPVLPVSDTLLLAEHVSSICMVAHATKTPRRCVLRALHLLDRAEASPIGIILNQVKPGRDAQYYYNQYGSYRRPGKGEAMPALDV